MACSGADTSDVSPRGVRTSPLSLTAVTDAIRQLTVFARRGSAESADHAMVWYPLIGLLLGAVWLATDVIAQPLTGRFGASVAVVVLAAGVTRGQAILGAGRTVAGLLSPARTQAIDHAYGGLTPATLLWAAIVWLVQLLCLSCVDRWRPIGLVCAPLLGRWSMVVLAFGSRAARPDGKRLKFAPGVTFQEFGWASSATLALIFWATGMLGIVLFLCTAVPIVGLRLLLHRRLDGITPASLGAACALAETIPLAALALV